MHTNTCNCSHAVTDTILQTIKQTRYFGLHLYSAVEFVGLLIRPYIVFVQVIILHLSSSSVLTILTNAQHSMRTLYTLKHFRRETKGY